MIDAIKDHDLPLVERMISTLDLEQEFTIETKECKKGHDFFFINTLNIV